MCDYRFPAYATDSNHVLTGDYAYCQRAPQFWVQSLLSQHSSLVCAHHLARTVRSIEAEARKYDLLTHDYAPDTRYERKINYWGGKTRIQRTTSDRANYARVTVKPYTPNGR